MSDSRFVPSASYGVPDRTPEGSAHDQAIEQIRHLAMRCSTRASPRPN